MQQEAPRRRAHQQRTVQPRAIYSSRSTAEKLACTKRPHTPASPRWRHCPSIRSYTRPSSPGSRKDPTSVPTQGKIYYQCVRQISIELRRHTRKVQGNNPDERTLQTQVTRSGRVIHSEVFPEDPRLLSACKFTCSTLHSPVAVLKSITFKHPLSCGML